jgi:O-antigen biosynthesis protein
VNILFVNYGDFTTNSLNHIEGFADALTQMGCTCAVAVPENLDTVSVLRQTNFLPVLFSQALAQPLLFPNGAGPDIVHAWTPREVARQFVVELSRLTTAHVIVHLEDNEALLTQAFTGKTELELASLTDLEWKVLGDRALSHPVRSQNFLTLADGVTYITSRLAESVPPASERHLLLPGVDLGFYRPQPRDDQLRAELGILPFERAIVYTGSATFANQADLHILLAAIHLLNQRGERCRLIRTGLHPEVFYAGLDFDWQRFTCDLGFVEKQQLPQLLAAADVLVQPGSSDAFNDFRLPSKLPEYFASGRPTILPATNLGLLARDGDDCLLLRTGDPEEIAAACARVFRDPDLAERLAKGGRTFAEKHFDLQSNTAKLLAFYQRVREQAQPPSFAGLRGTFGTEDSLLVARACRDLAAGATPEAALAAVEQRLASFALLDTEVSQLAANQAELKEQLREEQARADTRQHERNLLAEESNAALAEAETALKQLRDQLDQAEQEIRLELRPQIARLHVQLLERSNKINRMSRSASWRMTAPLRALRRALVDPVSRYIKGSPPATRHHQSPARLEPAIPSTSFATGWLIHLDRPFEQERIPLKLRAEGWCFQPGQPPAIAVRAVIGCLEFCGSAGLRRVDVAAGHPGEPAAETSGFRIDADLPPGLGSDQIRFELQLPSGEWRQFAVRTVEVSERPEDFADPRDYPGWVEQFDSFDETMRRELQAQLARLPQAPLISMLLPVYNPPEKWLRRAVASVQEQVYQNWELCIADDASPNEEIRKLLRQLAAEDPRIKLVLRPQNGHISASSNSALEVASGEFVALLDHDDELPPHALAEVALAIAQTPDAGFIYSDEDKIDESGKRFDPYFKPDWNPDLLRSQNYTCHLSVFRRDLVESAGGFRAGFEGSQDWDLTLRVTERLDPRHILHIPKILYHWRAIEGSTSLAGSAKSYTLEAAQRALASHIERLGLPAALEAVPGGHWRIRYHVPLPHPLVSIIIPTRNQEPLLRRCIESIETLTQYRPLEIIVVDNGSDDPATLRLFAELRERGVRVIDYPHPFNYAAINNTAVAACQGEMLAFLNNDLEVIAGDWLDEMVGQAARPEIGSVGAMLYYPDDSVQHAGVILGIGGIAGHLFKRFPRGSEGEKNRLRAVQNFSAVTAACLVVRRSVFEQVGGFDAQQLAVAFNDVDLCLRIQAAGYRNVWTPFAELYHHESASRGAEDTPAKQRRFVGEMTVMHDRWGEGLKFDPAYNPNLTLETENHALARPPRRLPDGKVATNGQGPRMHAAPEPAAELQSER